MLYYIILCYIILYYIILYYIILYYIILYYKTICGSSWLITKIILRYTVGKTSKFPVLSPHPLPLMRSYFCNTLYSYSVPIL